MKGYEYEELILGEDKDEVASQIARLGKKYALHPLTLEDLCNGNQRSKFESFPTYFFIVWHFFHIALTKPVELHFITSGKHLILVSTDRPPPGHETWRHYFLPEGVESLRNLSHLMCKVLDQIVDDAEDYLSAIDELCDTMEDDVLVGLVDPPQILKVKKRIGGFDRKLASLEPVLHGTVAHFNTDQETALDFRNITDHFKRLQEDSSLVRARLSTVLDVYWAVDSARSNLQMQRLTLLATILAPITLWAGFFGMNFEYMPFKEPWFFWVGMFAMSASVASVVRYLYKRGAIKSIDSFRRLRRAAGERENS